MEKSSQIHFKRKKSSKKLTYARTSDFCNQRSLIRCKNFEQDDIIKYFLPQIGLQYETWYIFEIDFSCWLALRKQILLAKKALHLFFFLLKKQPRPLSTNVVHVWDLIFFYILQFRGVTTREIGGETVVSPKYSDTQKPIR